LEGTANITVRADGPRRTAVQFNSQYVLDGLRFNANGVPVVAIEWRFTSGSSDTQINLGVPVTCRPSYKIERDFLTEVSARL
jgi:hypothetical protein